MTRPSVPADPLGDLGRDLLRVLLDPASWKPGPTQVAVAAVRAGVKR